MDNLFTILFIAIFIIIAIRQDRKNKQQQVKRLEEMKRQMDEQAKEQSEEPAQRPVAPQRPTMPTPEEIAEKHAELMRRHKEQLAERQRRQAAQMNDNKSVEMPDLQGRAYTIQSTPKPANSRATKAYSTTKTDKTTPINMPTAENAKTSNTKVVADKEFEFDIERAVVEAEILKPKYLDY